MAPRLTVISRKDAGLGPVDVGYAVPHQQFRGLVGHHDAIAFKPARGTTVEAAKARSRVLERVRPDLGPDWPYSWGIAPDYDDEEHAIVVEGRGWGRTGAHTKDFNSTRYGIVFFGNYETQRATAGAILGFRFLGAWLANAESAAETMIHRQLRSTACPGLHIAGAAGFLNAPFTATDIHRVMGTQPAPANVLVPAFNPPLDLERVVDSLECPSGGAWVLTEDGAVYGFGGARYFGGANGKPYFLGRRAARLRPWRDSRGRERYLVVDSTRSEYGHEGF